MKTFLKNIGHKNQIELHRLSSQLQVEAHKENAFTDYRYEYKKDCTSILNPFYSFYKKML